MIKIIRDLVNDDIFKEVLNGGILSFSAKVVAKIIGFASSLIVARYYGAETIGYVSIIISILGIFLLLSNFGMTTSILRLIPEYTERYSKKVGLEIYDKMLTMTFVISIGTGLILFFSSRLIANNVFHNNEFTFFFKLAAFVLIFSAFNGLNLATIRAMKKIKEMAIFELLPSAITLILLLFTTHLFYNIDNPVYILYSTIIITTVLTTICLKKINNKSVSKHQESSYSPSYKSLIILSFPMFFTAGLQFIIGQIDIIMLGIYENNKQVGIYSVVLSLAFLTVFLINSINTIAAPKFSELFHTNRIKDLQHVAQKSTKVIFWTTLPIIIILVLFGQLILNIYGPEFGSGYLSLLFLSIGQFVSAISGSVGYMLNMTGYQIIFRNIIFLSAIINIIMNYFLIPIYGISGAAFSSMISVILWNMIGSYYVKKSIGFHIMYLPFIFKTKNAAH